MSQMRRVLCNDRCPQTGVTATDDTQVTALGTNEGGVCVGA